MSDDTSDLIRVGPVRTTSKSEERRLELSAPRILRIVLPLTAAALVVALFFPRIGGGSGGAFKLSVDEALLAAGTRVENPRVTGLTADGATYAFKADVAKPDSIVPDVIDLEGIGGELTMPNGRTFTMRAATGRATQSSKTFQLDGGVSIATSDGYRIETYGVTANSAERVAESTGRILGFGPAGRFWVAVGNGVAHRFMFLDEALHVCSALQRVFRPHAQ